VTERKKRERELQRYETIVETIRDGIYVVDEDGFFTQVNDAYLSMTGFERAELVGEHVFDRRRRGNARSSVGCRVSTGGR